MVGYVDKAPGAGVATRSIGTCWPDRGSQVPRDCLTSRRRLAERGSGTAKRAQERQRGDARADGGGQVESELNRAGLGGRRIP
jgi:hypothetical protein